MTDMANANDGATAGKESLGSSDLFQGIALMGPSLFFEVAVPSSELSSRFQYLSPGTARDYFLLRTAAEIQKCALASQRWSEERKRAVGDSNLSEIRRESLVVEQTAWLRRLLEALVTLIAFQRTNSNEYYFHYLAVVEIEREHRRREDQRIYFGRVVEEIDRLWADALARHDKAYAALPDTSLCWYLQSGRPRIRPLRERYELALTMASPSERHALGYTYEASFGAASEAIHFSVLEESEPFRRIDRVVDSFCWLLTIGILCRLHDLSGVPPKGVNASLTNSRRELDLRPPRMSQAAAVGVFVVIEGPRFGQVAEINASRFGYEVYRIEPLPATATDVGREIWLPAPAVRLFMSLKEFEASIRASISESVQAEISFTEADIMKASRNAVIEMWNIAGPKLFSSGNHAPDAP